MTYNRNAGYPSGWVHLSYMQNALDQKLRGRAIDLEKIKNYKCGWRIAQSGHGTVGNITEGFSKNSIFKTHLVNIEKLIGFYDQGIYLNHGEILMRLSSKGCPTLWQAHIETRPRSEVGDKYAYIHICAFPKDKCDQIVRDTEGCMGDGRGCSVGLEIHQFAHPMEPGEPPPYEPPTESYMECSTNPTNASIWLKKH